MLNYNANFLKKNNFNKTLKIKQNLYKEILAKIREKLFEILKIKQLIMRFYF